MIKKLLHIPAGVLIILLFFSSGCAKEYSYEGGNTGVIQDSIQSGNPVSWICPACIGNDAQIEGKWSFHYENLLFCGKIDSAIVNPERTAFTFFGPSACSADSGMVVSVYLDGPVLDQNLYNLSSQRGAFYYYDHVGPSIYLISRPANPFTVTIDSYIHQTRLVTGTFKGPVFKNYGNSTYISSGKFKVKLF